MTDEPLLVPHLSLQKKILELEEHIKVAQIKVRRVLPFWDG
jgi:hypothetical protein